MSGQGNGTDRPYLISWTTSNLTATGGAACVTGVDYVSASGVLSFATGENGVKDIVITVCGDTAFEPNETFMVSLTAASPGGGQGANIGGDDESTGTINNDDAADATPPTVSSINRDGASPTNATSVSWTVTFSESVSGVDAADFALVQGGGVTGASITTVTGSGTTRVVTANTGTGSGTLGLNLVDDDSITDAASNKLGGTGASNGNFTGQVYAIDKAAPTVSSMNRDGASPTNATSVSWTVTFSESVSGVDAADFALVQGGGVTGASITTVTGSGTTRVVTANTGTGSGTLGLNLVDDDSITDAAGNKLGGTGASNGNFTGQVYAIDKAAPTVSIDLQAGSDTGISSTDDITRALSLAFDVDFNEDVSGVTAADLSLSGTAIGCSVGSLTGGPTVYDLTVTGCNAGTVTVTFAANGASDTAGNNGPAAATDSATVTIDRTAPVATIDLQDASDTGTSDSDNITKALSLTFDVTFDEDVFTLAASDFSNAGTATGCTFGAPMGSGDTYTVTVSTCSEGTVILRLAAAGVTDTAGNDNVQTDSATVTIDRTAPVVSAPDLDSASDTGVSAADNVTNDDNPDFSGSAEANAFVELLRDGSVVASESAIGSAWSLTDIGPVADGPHTYTTRATDAAGNTSAESAGLLVVIDTVALVATIDLQETLPTPAPRTATTSPRRSA